MDKKKAAIWIGGAALAAFLWLALGTSDELEIDVQSCKPIGFVAETRSSLQGAQFNRDQVRALEKSLVDNQKAIALLYAPLPAHAQQALSEAKRVTQSVMEDIYRKNPELRPSPYEIEANRLREQADRLEHQGRIEKSARLLTQYGQSLERCRLALSK